MKTVGQLTGSMTLRLCAMQNAMKLSCYGRTICPRQLRRSGRLSHCLLYQALMRRRPRTRSMLRQLHVKLDIRWLLVAEAALISGQIGLKSCITQLRRMARIPFGGAEGRTLLAQTWKCGGAKSKELRSFHIQRVRGSLRGSMVHAF